MTRTALYLIFGVLPLTACRTPASTSEQHAAVRTDTLHVFRQHIDSISLHDSVFLAYMGDTIIKERHRTHTRYIVRTDTLYRVRTDTLRISERRTIKEPYTPKPVRWIATLGGVALLGWLFFLVLKIRRL